MTSHRRDLRIALEAIERGWLPVEDVLRAALARTERPDLWDKLKRKLAPRNQAIRRPYFRRHKRYPTLVAAKAMALARKRYEDHPGVLSVHWGLRRLAGETTSESCVVIFVETKRRPTELKTADRIRPAVTVRHGQRSYGVRIDVQGVGRHGRLHAIDHAEPGNRTKVWNQNADLTATLSAIATGTDGQLYAIVSGHFAKARGNQIVATPSIGASIQLGGVAQCIFNAAGDVASVGPLPPGTDPTLLTSPALPARDPEVGDLTHQVWVFTRTNPEGRATYITDVHCTFTGYDIVIPELAATSNVVSDDGDSGSPAIDSQGNLVGFVVGGSATRTYLMPARRALNEIL